MIHYRYVEHFTPPAPFVNVNVHCLATGARAEKQPAQVDSAADRTVLPDRLVAALGLVEDGRLLFQGFAGQVVELPVFLNSASTSGRSCGHFHSPTRALQ
jgi:hypothetical protein